MRNFFVLVGVILGLVLIAATPDKPNLSGTWKVNFSKSDYGMIPPPTSRTDAIEQKGDDFKITSDSEISSGKEHYVLKFTADGKEVTVAPDSPNAHLGAFNLKKLKAEWNGTSLVLTETGSIQDMDASLKNVYNLSAEGKMLTIASHITFPVGEIGMTGITLFSVDDARLCG